MTENILRDILHEIVKMNKNLAKLAAEFKRQNDLFYEFEKEDHKDDTGRN